MKFPTQAAILCGGLGTRLRPLTDTIPKPMVDVNGYPFLAYLLRQLRKHGIQDVVIMTGYLGEQIHEYFGDGSSFGLNIQYAHGPVDWDTGRRLVEAKPLLQDKFWLLYADNYVPLNFQKMAEFYAQHNRLLAFVVQEKNPGNVRLRDDGAVDTYDRTRAGENLGLVELGYMIVDRKVFDYFSDQVDVSFADILVKLAADQQICGWTVHDAYQSIGDLARLEKTRCYFSGRKLLLVDRDGVINEKAPRGEYITSWDDFRFIPDTVDALKRLGELGFEFLLISNQAGIGRGVMTRALVDGINDAMCCALKTEGITVLQTYVCPHHWEDGCFCRKPQPGMFFQASKDWVFPLERTFFIGDDPRDCQAAVNAGCKGIFIGDPKELQALNEEEAPALVVDKLSQAVDFLEHHDYFKNTF